MTPELPSPPQIQTITPDSTPPQGQATSENARIFLAGLGDNASYESFIELLQKRLRDIYPHFPGVSVYKSFQLKNDPQVDKAPDAQVDWELEQQDRAHVIVIFFHHGGDDSEALFTLGYHAHDKNVLVSCQKSYRFIGKAQAVCIRYNVPVTDSLGGLVDLLVARLIATNRCGFRRPGEGLAPA